MNSQKSLRYWFVCGQSLRSWLLRNLATAKSEESRRHFEFCEPLYFRNGEQFATQGRRGRGVWCFFWFQLCGADVEELAEYAAARVYIYIHILIYAYKYTFMYIHIFLQTYVNTDVNMFFVNMCRWIYICKYTYVLYSGCGLFADFRCVTLMSKNLLHTPVPGYNIYVYIHVYLCICICIYVYLYIYVHMYIVWCV